MVKQIKLLFLVCALFGQCLLGMQKTQEQGKLDWALIRAYYDKDFAAFKKALEAGANPNVESAQSTILFKIYNSYDRLPDKDKHVLDPFIDLLLQSPHLNINKKDGSGDTILFEVAALADERRVKMILAVPQIELNSQNDWGATVLWNISFRETSSNDQEQRKAYRRILALLLAHGADPGIKNNRGKDAYGNAHGDLELLKLLKTGREEYLAKLKAAQAAQAAVVEPVETASSLPTPLCRIISEYAVGPQELEHKKEAAQEEKKAVA